MTKALTKLSIEIIQSRVDGMELVEALSNYLSQLGVKAKLSMEIEIEPIAYKQPIPQTMTYQQPMNTRPQTLTQPGITPVPELSEMEGMFNQPVVKVMSFADVIQADKNAPQMVDEEGAPTTEQDVVFHGSEGKIKRKYPVED